MQIIGLPEHLKNYSLAYFEYFATGEGLIIQAELLNNNKQTPSIGYSEIPVEKIPCVVELVRENQTYLEWNPTFKMRFLECFGSTIWSIFEKGCGLHNKVLDLKLNTHYHMS